MIDGGTVVTGRAVEASTVITLFTASLANEAVNEFLTISIAKSDVVLFLLFSFSIEQRKQKDIWMVID